MLELMALTVITSVCCVCVLISLPLLIKMFVFFANATVTVYTQAQGSHKSNMQLCCLSEIYL